MDEPNDGHANINISKDILITDFDDPLTAIVQYTYPNFLQNYKNTDFMQCIAIMAGTLETIGVINRYVLELIPSNLTYEVTIYFLIIT